MGYRIEYGKTPSRSRGDGGWFRLCMTGLFLAGFCLLVSAFWPEGRELLRSILIPGDAEVTLEAAEVFARELGGGISLTEAAEHFCIAVLEHGNPGGY